MLALPLDRHSHFGFVVKFVFVVEYRRGLLLCSAHPKVSASDMARLSKSIMARDEFQALPALRKKLCDALLRYIRGQEQK